MDRREFVKKSAAGLVAGGVLTGCGVNHQSSSGTSGPSLQWRLVSSYPRSLDTLFGASELVSKRVAAMTNGRFKIHVYPPGEIVPGLQVFDAVQQGTVQMGQTAGYYYTGKHPAFVFDTTVPFGLTNRQQMAWLRHSEGGKRLKELFAEFNLVNFAGGGTGAQMGGWFREEVNSLADLKGLKMRIPGLGGKVMDRLGVTVQVLAGADIYPALERGAIDATEWVGPYDDEKLGFYKVAKYYYYPGWWEPGANLNMCVNKTAWDSLPPNYQQVLETAIAEAAFNMTTEYDSKNPEALQSLLSKGVQLRRFSDDLMQAAKRETDALMEEDASKDPVYREIYSSYKQWREDSFQWFGTNEFAYAQFSYGG